MQDAVVEDGGADDRRRRRGWRLEEPIAQLAKVLHERQAIFIPDHDARSFQTAADSSDASAGCRRRSPPSVTGSGAAWATGSPCESIA